MPSQKIRQKRMAFILKGYPRLSETFIAQEIYLLEQRGFDLEIFSMRKAREPEKQPIIDKIKAPVTYIPEYILPELMVFVGSQFRLLFRQPFRHLKVFFSAVATSLRERSRSPFKRFLQASWLVNKKDLLSPGIDHFHSHFIHAPTELTYYMCLLTEKSYSISAHAKDIYTSTKKQIRTRINASEFLMTCTQFNYEYFKSISGVQKEKVHRVYHGINPEYFTPSTLKLDLKAPFKFLSIGRLVEKKGYDIIFQALKIIKNKGFEFSYDIYGEGELEDELNSLVDDLGLKKEVNFKGRTTHTTLLEVMKEKNVFLCGSKVVASGDRDGIPNTVAEAMAMKQVVIATDVSGIPELVSHEIDGIMVPSESPEKFAGAIERVISDQALAERLSENAREKVEKIFNCHQCIDVCEGLLRPYI